MKQENRKLLLDQVDRKLEDFVDLRGVIVPERGWIHTIRTALNISLRQLARRMGVSQHTVRSFELREAEGGITMKSLRAVAQAMDMQLVYALIPNDGSLEQLIEKQAEAIARSIVLRTSKSMALEDQEVSKERLRKAIEAKTEEIVRTMPRYLWD